MTEPDEDCEPLLSRFISRNKDRIMKMYGPACYCGKCYLMTVNQRYEQDPERPFEGGVDPYMYLFDCRFTRILASLVELPDIDQEDDTGMTVFDDNHRQR